MKIKFDKKTKHLHLDAETARDRKILTEIRELTRFEVRMGSINANGETNSITMGTGW